jgi:predicted ArsR family transcriptional regulator
MDTPARPDDALAQPTRARLFDLLTQLRRPAATDELARTLELHPNGVRVHLERLRADGLVLRQRPPSTRGRPPDMWSVAADARPGGEQPSGYAELGRWLARAIAPGRTSVRTVERTGREVGRELASTGDAPPELALHATLAAMGFAPHREPGAPGDVTYRLCNCPYRAAVHENADVVCALHRGITRGLLDVLAPETTLAAFVPRDPDLAGCLVQLRGGLTTAVTA